MALDRRRGGGGGLVPSGSFGGYSQDFVGLVYTSEGFYNTP